MRLSAASPVYLALIASLALGSGSPAFADGCGDLFREVDLSAMPPPLRDLVSAGAFAETVKTYESDPTFAPFYAKLEATLRDPYAGKTADEIAARLASDVEPVTATFVHDLFTVNATLKNVGNAKTRMIFEVEKVGGASGKVLLELQALQMTTIARLFMGYDAKTLEEVSIFWNFRKGGEKLKSIENLGFESNRPPVTSRCGGWRKILFVVGKGLVSSTIGGATVFGLTYVLSDDLVDPGSRAIGFGAGGAIVAPLVTLAASCRKRSVRPEDVIYELAFKRITPKTE